MSGPHLAHLPVYDVRVRRELAHRRFVVSLLRQLSRLATLHALDAVAVVTAFFVARELTEVTVSTESLPAVIAFVLVGLNLQGSYSSGNARRDARRLVTGTLIAAVLMAIPATLPQQFAVSSQFVVVFGLAAVAALIVERRFVDAIVHQAYVRGYGLRRAVVITRSHEFKDLIAGLETNGRSGGGLAAEDHVVVGYVTPDIVYDSAALGSLSDVERILEERDVSEVLVATSLRNERLTELADACFERGVRVLVIPPAPHALRGWAELTRVGSWPAYQLHPARLELPALILKRATDLMLASVGMVVGVPLMLLIAIGIKVESRGPVFFRQKRVGLGGREFMMWKFRSMSLEAEAKQHEIAHLNSYEDPRLFKMPRDPRITRVGRLLRRFSLDELPQLLNILAGDMSVVGPRPPLPSEVTRYESRHYIRLSVVPGLTGPWQVNGRNLITDFEEVVRLEREYIEGWSLRSDIEIILRTLGVVLSGKGAY
jgi:exopolysaccharide biosynthesis polyprenyl glycosylphosphotransferase